MSGPHTAVKRELLVRYLDAWTPAALHRNRQAVFVCWAGLDPARTALRVFAEFADLLQTRTVTMLLPPTVAVADLPAVPGVVASVVDRPAARAGTAVFGWYEHSTVDVIGDDVVLVSASRVDVPGRPLACRVELVAADGESEFLVFATASEKALERFKEALWALDEYAGIQLRDPADEKGELCDISAVAHLGPLRRSLLRHLAGGDGATLGALRTWTLHDTMFRAGETNRAVQALLTAGSVSREPSNGRLSAETVIRLAT
jgi:hypothetical protein